MSKCIYCNDHEADSKEHAIPACLGTDYIKNYELLKNKLCQGCNGKIGALEEQFCRCSPVGFFRRLTGIKGRKHREDMNPFYRGSSGSAPMLAETEHPSLDCILLGELKEGSKDFIPARQIIVKDSGGKHHPILIADWMKSTDDFNKVLESKGLLGSVPVEFYANPEEHGLLSDICRGLPNFAEFTELTPVVSESNKELVVTIYTTDKYFRAIAKIAFHHFLQHFTQFSGAEEEFEGIRKFIMDGGKVKDWVKNMPGTFLYDLKDPHIFIDKYAHFIAAEKNDRYIVSKMVFFIGPEAKPLAYFQVTIGRNPERIHYPQKVGHQIVYFEQKDNDGYIGIMQPMNSVSQLLL